jgi:Flp pilus assembly protein TadG
VIALPILLALILGIIQFALVYEAKATLNHATLLAARAGAVDHAQPQAILSGLARGLVPLYSPDSSFQGYQSTLARVTAAVTSEARVRILNPTQEAFADFSEEVEGVREIPNDRLHVRSTALGTQSGLNIQDANLLRVQVMYGYELNVPLVNWFITRTLLAFDSDDGYDAFERQLLQRTRLPILSTSTVRMHTPARMSDLVVARADLPDIQRFDAGSAPPDIEDESEEEDEEEQEEGAPGEETEQEGSTLADGFLGFGSGSGNSSSQPGGGTGSGGGDDDWIVGGGGPSDCAINTCCSPPRTPI